MSQDVNFIIEFILENFIRMLPYLLLSVPLAVLVRLTDAKRFIEQAFNHHPLIAIVLATLVGAFSPFCSCTVIPIITSLLIANVPLGPVMAFWVASPSMDPEIFLLSVGILGKDLAIARVVATLFLSLGAGFLAHYLQGIGIFSAGILRAKHVPVPATTDSGCSCNVSEPSCGCSSTPVESSCGCSDTPAEPSAWQKVWKESYATIGLVVKFMLIAFLLEAVITLYVPQETIVKLVGSDNPSTITLMALIGIPIYTTNLTALPLIGGLLDLGLLPGAALAFLIAGPTTTIPAMTAVYGIAKPRVFALYIGITLVGSIILGYGFQLIL